MTGFGEAHCQSNNVAVAVELRSINSRYFKLTVRAPEGFAALEPAIEANLRKHIKRGTVQVNLRVDRETKADDYRINDKVLESYRQQLGELGIQTAAVPWETLLMLPGVVDESAKHGQDATECWPLIESTLNQAAENLARMRAEEGAAMAQDLKSNCLAIAEQVDQVEPRSSEVVENYRSRLTDRLQKLLADYDVTVDSSDVIREVGIFAERCDISEEIVRLRSHLEQFHALMDQEESSGRKLEFLTQEMFRETNTIGSKANDAQIAQHVIEIKAAIERMREMIQNVE